MTTDTELPKRISALRHLRGLTNDQVAVGLGVDASTVSRMQSGARGLSTKALLKWAQVLGVDAADLMNPSMTPQDVIDAAADRGRKPAVLPPPRTVSEPEPMARLSRARIPVYGQAVGGPSGEGRFVLNGVTLDWIPAPPGFDNVRNPYAVRVYGSSMEPRLRPGETLYVDPNVPVRVGDDVVVQVAGDDGEVHGYVKEFVSRTGRDLVLRQLNPPEGEEKLIRIPTENTAVHRIVWVGRN